VVALLVLAWAVHHIVSRYIRVGVLVTAALLVLAVAPYAKLLRPAPLLAQAGAPSSASVQASPGPDALLHDFYEAEARRVVSLPDAAATASAPPFDIVFLHVCSLSWDDLQFSGLDGHPLWSRFDALFTRFNSAASYSGPSAIRINRALCGQTTHQGLYDSAPDSCYLFPNLKRAGFTPELAMNHDGHFDDFLSVLRRQGVNAPPLPLGGTPVPQRGFDNSPIHDDLAVLARWLDGRRQADPDQTAQARAALYYNTISLHDGNKLSTGARLDAVASYRLRAGKLFDDIDAFLRLLEESGRRAIVVLTPEHGAALRGDRYQIAGLRDMPTPRITHVPVGVKVIGARRDDEALRIDQPSSYLGLSQLLAQLIATPPYEAHQGQPASASAGFRMADYARQLPATDYVADNEGTVVLALPDADTGTGAGHYLLQRNGQAWQDYAP
jgi:cellulose synthase operon protein YhjU